MTKKQALIAAATILLLSPAAQADMDPVDTYIPSTDITDAVKTPHSGWYIGGGFGVGAHFETWNFQSGERGSSFQFFPDVAVDLGYQFNPYFAMGLYAFTDFQRFDTENGSGYFVGVPILLYFKGIMPLSDRLNLFAKVGLGYSTSPDLFLTAGVGTSYQLTQSLAFSVGFDWHYSMLENIFDDVFDGVDTETYTPTLTANLTYFFGT